MKLITKIPVFDYLSFDGDERLITIQKIYCINNDIVESLNNAFIVEVNMNRM